ncbi:hypothetical protein H4I95_10207 [Botrytis cinerea]
MEDVLEAFEDLAMATRTTDPTPQESCNAIHKIYQLKRQTPKLTYVLKFLEDKKVQDSLKWGAVTIGGVVPAGSAATGSTVAAVGSTAAVSGAAVGGVTAAATSGSIIEGAALALSGIAGGIIGGSTIVTITSFVEKAESSNNYTVADQENRNKDIGQTICIDS